MGVRLVHIGDSVTNGQRVAEDLRWPALVDRRLEDLLGSNEVEASVAAVNGETTRLGLERFPRDVQDRRPDIITLQYGMNDCNCWETDRGLPRVSEDAFSANIEEMIRRARHFGAREVILTTNPCSLRRFEMQSGEAYEEANARYSELLRGVAARTDVTLCDVRAAFEALDDDGLATKLHSDLLHLSPAGHVLYADAIWPFVSAAAEELLGLAAEPGSA